MTAETSNARGVVDDCHCATCTCHPGMTPAIRFDTTPAEREGAVRDHLIALGWTPPGAQQPAAEEQLTYKGVPIGPMQTFADMERQASAPVGVDAPGSRAWMAEVCRAAALSLAEHGVRNDQLSKVADWIAQQPADVDEAMAAIRKLARDMKRCSLGGATRSALRYSDDLREYADRLLVITSAIEVWAAGQEVPDGGR